MASACPASAFRIAAALLPLLLAVVIAPPASAVAVPATVASTIDDLCPATADPCTVSEVVTVRGGSRLDVGLRTLRIEGRGLLDFEDGGEVACGRLEMDTDGVAIRVRGAARPTGLPAPVVVTARAACSANPSAACLLDSDCEAVGAGTCTGGDGRAWVRGAVLGNAENPGRFVLRSAGDLRLLGEASVSGTRAVSDGGTVDLESTGGSVVVSAMVDVSGGGAGSGGSTEILAAGDIEVLGEVRARGGDYDGGTVTLEAGRDVVLGGDVRLDSVAGAGVGGELEAAAGRDLRIDGGSASRARLLSADGHQSADSTGGDGGTMTFEAGRDLAVSEHVRLRASGAIPDGFADTISFEAGGNLRFDGRVAAKGRGGDGGGGLLELLADGRVEVSSTADFDLTGAAAGGDLAVEAAGAIVFAGEVDVSAASSGLGGRVVATALGDLEVSGAMRTSGAPSILSVGDLFLEGCRVRVSGSLANAAVAGRNRILAHEGLAVSPGASLLATGEGGSNAVIHRGGLAPLLLQGNIVPAALVQVDPALEACAVCEDGSPQGQPGCDDGDEPDEQLCSEVGTTPLEVRRLRLRRGRRPGHDRVVWKLDLPAAPLPGLALQDHWTGAWRVRLLDALQEPVVETLLPAGAFQPARGRHRFRAVAESAPGSMVKAVAVVDEDGGRILVRLKQLGADLPVMASSGTLSTLVAVDDAAIAGQEEATVTCMDSGDLECVHGQRRVLCASPRPSPD